MPKHFIGAVPVFSNNFLQKDQGMILLTKTVAKGSSVKVKQDKLFLPGTCKLDDWYPKNPTAGVSSSSNRVASATVKPRKSITSNTLLSFFNWLYKYYPDYQTKYGNQKYLSRLYDAFLNQSVNIYDDGNHLTSFFVWLYRKFPMYQSYYGNQTYLTELYNYYINGDFHQ